MISHETNRRRQFFRGTGVALGGLAGLGLDLKPAAAGSATFQLAVNPNRLTAVKYRAPHSKDWEEKPLDWAMDRSQPLPALWPRTAAPDQSTPSSPSAHRPTAPAMGGLNRCAYPPRRSLYAHARR